MEIEKINVNLSFLVSVLWLNTVKKMIFHQPSLFCIHCSDFSSIFLEVKQNQPVNIAEKNLPLFPYILCCTFKGTELFKWYVCVWEVKHVFTLKDGIEKYICSFPEFQI